MRKGSLRISSREQKNNTFLLSFHRLFFVFSTGPTIYEVVRHATARMRSTNAQAKWHECKKLPCCHYTLSPGVGGGARIVWNKAAVFERAGEKNAPHLLLSRCSSGLCSIVFRISAVWFLFLQYFQYCVLLPPCCIFFAMPHRCRIFAGRRFNRSPASGRVRGRDAGGRPRRP